MSLSFGIYAKYCKFESKISNETLHCFPDFLRHCLLNIVQARLLFFFNSDVCVVGCSDGQINSQEYKSFEMYAVTGKISMTEYHH